MKDGVDDLDVTNVTPNQERTNADLSRRRSARVRQGGNLGHEGPREKPDKQGRWIRVDPEPSYDR